MTFELVNLFPTPVYHGTITLTKEEIDFAKNYDISSDNKLGNFYSGNSDVLELEVYKNLKKDVEHHINQYANNVLSIDHELYISLSWFNRNPPGSEMHKHWHANSFLSGCLYFTDGAEIKFWADKSPLNNDFFDLPAKEYNPWNSSNWALPIKTNDILIWPSYLRHSVVENTSNDDRLSLAFNVFLKFPIGSRESLTHLDVCK